MNKKDCWQQVTDQKIASELIAKLQSNEEIEILQTHLREDLLKDYNEGIVKIVFENIIINDSKKYEKFPIEIIPNDAEEFKKQFIETGVAKLCYHFKDGRVEEKIWGNRNFSETANLKANLRSRPEARKEKWKQLGIVKLVCKI